MTDINSKSIISKQIKGFVLTIHSANLTVKQAKKGDELDPYVRLYLTNPGESYKGTNFKNYKCDGSKLRLARTETKWNAGSKPVWNYVCPAYPLEEGHLFELCVMEDNVFKSKEHLGSALFEVNDLLQKCELSGDGKEVQLRLLLNDESVGSIFITAVPVKERTNISFDNDMELSCVDESLFINPVKRLGVSGGTAPFFALKLAKVDAGQSPSYWIGKDLSRATDEVSFYEEVKSSSIAKDTLGGLVNFLFPYLGILKTTEEGDEKGTQLDLLIMRNLYDGCKKLRLVDIKIGEKTGSAGWQGKSRFRAFKQQLFDQFTNSAVEGFRLEGFDGPPQTLDSMETLTALLLNDKNSAKKATKKSRRFLFQNLNGSDILKFLLDLHFLTGDDTTYDSEEYIEIIFHELVKKLISLAVCCHKVKVPQKWIGSSLALGFDAGELPSKSKSEDEIRKGVIVNIFDWGRSELNAPHKMMDLTPAEVKDRNNFWDEYKYAMNTMSWIAAKNYYLRFATQSWKEVVFSFNDFDVVGDKDEMVELRVPLEKTEKTTVTLAKKGFSKLSLKHSTFTYSIEMKPCSDGSRLKQIWKITAYEAKNLPKKDLSITGGSSDPFIIVTAVSDNGSPMFRQMSTVKKGTINPVWNETFSIPVVTNNDGLEDAMRSCGVEVCDILSTSLESWTEKVKKSDSHLLWKNNVSGYVLEE